MILITLISFNILDSQIYKEKDRYIPVLQPFYQFYNFLLLKIDGLVHGSKEARKWKVCGYTWKTVPVIRLWIKKGNLLFFIPTLIW